ncbi:MAG: UDP-3-O-(3-hydroxymyristoyl)glucosamine N-acyltransferase [Sediminibacterium sp.]|jgi:UDP-3-O-[3-hydroxymyristoyl] glucosamine N-acyltransferase|nr:UDP-3-O-(3-hydroxymyristoyl)glucosamine N-acyltransferase [Sediminibacterium sp.]
MKLLTPVSVAWLSKLTNAEIIGNQHLEITGVNEIHQVELGDIVFVDHPKYYNTCLNSEASCIIINDKNVIVPEGKALLFCTDPFEAYLKIVKHFKPFIPCSKAISDDAIIGEGTIIMPHVFIGPNVTIGKNCVLHPSVSILSDTIIGDEVIIQANTVIGSDAFYYNTKKDRQDWFKKLLSCGRVVIQDKVEIGAGCTIDRGVSGDTIVGRGTKIDNMVHIGHDTQIEANCLFAAGVAIAGGVQIKSGVTLWGQVGVTKTITIGENATVLGHSGVTGSLAGNKVYMGFPAEDSGIKKREIVWIKRIPELWKKVME